jgi:hypothetical protein
VHIPKDKGRTRPIGVSAIEAKMVQDAIREVLEAIYEQSSRIRRVSAAALEVQRTVGMPRRRISSRAGRAALKE